MVPSSKPGAGHMVRARQRRLRPAPQPAAQRLLPAAGALLVLWMVVGLEWLWWLGPAELSPLWATAIATLTTAWVVTRCWPELRRLLGVEAAAQSSVAEELEQLRKLGFRLCHDLPLDSGNADHVVVSTHGVYCIEVRRRSLPPRLERRIRYDGTAVAVNNYPPDASAILRPLAQARQLKRLLKERTGVAYPVRAVLLYPGWQVESLNAREHSDVWVLAPKSLAMWIRHEPERVTPADMRKAAAALDTYLGRFR